jgi:hypothetical protein
MYIAALVTTRLSEVDAAEALADDAVRTENSRLLRNNLEITAGEACDLWQRLKRYVIKAFPKTEQEIRLTAAGQQHYAKAANKDWEAVKRLLIDGSAFITANSVALLADDNMPPTFATAFNTKKTSFDTYYEDFLDASQDEEIETQTKVTANNEIHASVMSMMLDGQEIFKNNEAIKKLFTFDQVLLTVTGPGNQGFKGNISNATNDLPLGVTATVAITGPTNKTVETDENDHFDCPQLTAGEQAYTITVTATGYQTKILNNQTVNTGTMKTINIELTPTP